MARPNGLSDKEYIALLEARTDAVRKTAKALYDTGTTAGLLGVQLYNDLGEPLPERPSKLA